MKNCVICNHPDRVAIETSLLQMSPKDATSTLEQLAKAYDVPFEALQEHSMFHSSFGGDPEGNSIIRQIKMKEADMLAAVAVDQLSTIKAVGNRIRKCAVLDDPEDMKFERILTKPVVDLYIGAGDGLRKNVQTLTDINQLLNVPKDEGMSGLAALAQVLENSRKSDD